MAADEREWTRIRQYFFDLTPELKVISELAVFLLVFLAELEMKASHVGRSFRGRAAWISLAGFLIPFLAGAGLGPVLGAPSTRRKRARPAEGEEAPPSGTSNC